MQLTAKDIISLRLNADYVFLSACETIGSRNFSLEDNTLASAFLYNSTNSVLVSLWPIDDEATQVLMEYVIRLLKNNSEMGLNIALSKSIEKLIKLGYEHPFFWAGFMVIGKG